MLKRVWIASAILALVIQTVLGWKSISLLSNQWRKIPGISHVRMNDAAIEQEQFADEDLNSKQISKLSRKIAELEQELENVARELSEEQVLYKKLDEEFGDEIIRVKKEFARIKERSVEEASEIINTAKSDALKEVLPVADNYVRAKAVFQPLQTPNEETIYSTYDAVFADFNNVLEDFGVVQVESLGKPFDFNFMEAIMTSPSTEYAKDVVCQEYQVGYRMGDKCVRPAMVVVSLGPGPAL